MKHSGRPRDLASTSHTLGRALDSWIREPIRVFIAAEASGGIVLLVATAAALLWVNSPFGAGYHHFWHTAVGVTWGDRKFELSLAHWINDGLMALFFFWVGLEIKRELLSGELSSPRKAALPMMAALGGMVVPALLYAGLNAGGPGSRGWGIPMATDIAFAVGILMLLGRRVPLGLKVFLTAFAVVDDLGAVIVIAIFYTAGLDLGLLGVGLGLLGLLGILARRGLRHPAAYILLGVAVWYCFLRSGVHATVAGVLTAMTVPHRGLPGPTVLERWEHALAPFVAYGIMPVFALANAGVEIAGEVSKLVSPVPLGILLGLFLGKPVGILLFSWLAVRSRMASLPLGVGWRQVHGAATLGGIGFTMSLFIAALAFGIDAEGGILDSAKTGILAGSLLSAVLGSLLLLRAKPSPEGGAA